jgi:hypothetical protein
VATLVSLVLAGGLCLLFLILCLLFLIVMTLLLSLGDRPGRHRRRDRPDAVRLVNGVAPRCRVV